MIGHLRPISNFEELEKLPHLRKVFDSTVPPVVIFPVSHAVGLSVTRCLEKENVPILALDFKPRSAGLFSRRVSSVLIPEMYSSPDRFEEWMLRIGSLFRERPVLFLVDDEDLFLSLKHADRWQKYYRLPLSPWKVVSGIVNKAKFYRALKKANFPVPETWDTSSLARLKAQKAKIRFPCILKPAYSTQFRQTFGVKARKFDNLPDLLDFAATVEKAGIEYLVQEFIPGPAASLFTFAACSDENGVVAGSFCGRKIHQFPADFGTCRLGESIDYPELAALGKRMLTILKYQGISLTEFKRTPDGQLKVIELNPRPGDWPEHLSFKCGVNLVKNAYDLSIGRTVVQKHADQFGLKWANLPEDFYYSVRGYRLLGFPSAHRGFLGWLKDIRGLRTDAFFSVGDPLPFFVRLAGMISEFRRREKKIRADE